MLFEVYMCVQLNRWSVVCGCVLHRGQRGEGWCVSSTLCRYDIRMILLLVRSWARVRRVSLGMESSEWGDLGGRVDVIVCYGCVAGGVWTMLVCIYVEFGEICCWVTVSVSMLVV